jgi:hypothetical protein
MFRHVMFGAVIDRKRSLRESGAAVRGCDAFIIGLAEQIAPDEIDTAPAALARAEQNGLEWQKTRKRQTSTVVGGWAGLIEQAVVIPDTIAALQESWHMVQAVLELSIVGIHVAEFARWIREWRAGQKSTETVGSHAAVIHALDALREELIKRGFETATATDVAGVTLEALDTDRANAAEFMAAVRPK